MDNKEEEIVEELKLYKIQLSQVEEILKQSPSEDCLQLKKDLLELIQLTEESLLSLKKSKLLSLVDQLTANQATQSDELQDYNKKSPDLEASESGEEQDEPNDLIGTKCKVPFCHEWGQMSYHNAVVCGLESTEDGMQMVRVMFCNPTHNAMLTCRHFMNGYCRFEDSECRFSHGHLVPASAMKPLEEPDHQSFSVGVKCLAKELDDLWHKAVIVDIIEEDKVQVMFDSDNHLAIKELQDIFLAANSSDSDDDDDTSEEEDVQESIDDEPPLDVDNFTIQTSEVLGHWERHTKGIGSKLMLKMGYMIGQGLGKNSDGRALPIPIEILPQGKSLDKVIELRGKKKDCKNPHRKKKKAPSAIRKHKKASVFDVINSQLSACKKVQKCPRSRTAHHVTTQDLSKKSEKHINIQLLKTGEELKRSDHEMFKLTESLERSIRSGDEVTGRKMREKISSLQEYQDQLRMSEKYMNNQKNSRRAHKELFSF